MERHKCYRTYVIYPTSEDEEDSHWNPDVSSADKATDKITEALMDWCVVVSARDIKTHYDFFSDFVALDSQEDKIIKEIQGYQAIQMPACGWAARCCPTNMNKRIDS